MSEENNEITKEENIGEVGQTPLVIHRHFLKDMSFESPNAPAVLVRTNTQPNMDLNILLDVNKVEDSDIENMYEVVMTVTVTAKREDTTLFIAEVIYGTTASINGLEEKQHHPLLFIEVPNMMFPFMRQILANATQAGGFNPLQLSPVDFRSMYIARFAPKRAKKEAEARAKAQEAKAS